MKAINMLIIVIGSSFLTLTIQAALRPNDNPYYKRFYPSFYSKILSSGYECSYDYYDPYVRRSSAAYVISDYNYYTTPYSYYYY